MAVEEDFDKDSDLILNLGTCDADLFKSFATPKGKKERSQFQSFKGKDGDLVRGESSSRGEKFTNKDEKVAQKRKPPGSLFYSDSDVAVTSSSINLQNVENRKEPLFSKSKFSDFGIHPHLVSCLDTVFGISTATEIQKLAIPVLLEQNDALIKSHTGSGKTLAYAVPLMHRLLEIRPKISRTDGIHAVVVVPTRELALQTYEWFIKLSKACTWIVPGVLMGGEKKKSEKARIRKGLAVVIGTPGRLIDHLEHTSNFSLKKTTWFVIDEADRLLDMGFERDVSKIVSLWKEQSSGTCVLLSATLTKGVERLAGLSMVNPVVLDAATEVGVSELQEFVLPPGLVQYYVVLPIKLRLIGLSCLLLKAFSEEQTKMIIFMATQDIVDFYHSLFSGILQEELLEGGFKVSFFKLHGIMSQQDRAEVFKKFRTSDKVVLFTTDVASRGLDMPAVDWIVQSSVPATPEDYVHRAGRTARIGKEGRVVLFLLPSEMNYLTVLQKHEISLNEMMVSDLLDNIFRLNVQIKKHSEYQKLKTKEDYATVLHLHFEKSVHEEKELHQMAKKAYISFVRSYASYPKSTKDVLPFKSLHLGHVAKSFCLRETPTEVGAQHVPLGKFSQKKAVHPENRIPKKRKVEVSEYDSGLYFKKKRKLKNT